MSAYEVKQRHGCLTIWLILMIVMNSIATLLYAFGNLILREEFPDARLGLFALLAVISAFGVVCAIALLRWKKWGFWGCCASGLVGFGLNLSSGVGIGKSVYGLVGLGILFILLHTGEGNKAWPQLE